MNQLAYYIDTNILIYFLVGDKKFGALAKKVLEGAINGDWKIVSSAYIFAETFATLRAFGFSNELISEHLKNMLNFGIELKPLTEELILGVPSEMQKGVKFGDAIHLLTMHLYDLSKIITEDKHFENLNVKRLSLSAFS